MLEDVNDEIPLFTEREQETVLEGEPIGTKVTQVNAIDKDGTFPNNQVWCPLFIMVIFTLYLQIISSNADCSMAWSYLSCVCGDLVFFFLNFDVAICRMKTVLFFNKRLYLE